MQLTLSPLSTSKNPENQPSSLAGVHGILKFPAATLWLLGSKWNAMVSPLSTEKDSGSNLLSDVAVTLTVFAAAAVEKKRTAAVLRRDEGAMVMVEGWRWYCRGKGYDYRSERNSKIQSRRDGLADYDKRTTKAQLRIVDIIVNQRQLDST
jgi:hypothetical protein